MSGEVGLREWSPAGDFLVEVTLGGRAQARARPCLGSRVVLFQEGVKGSDYSGPVRPSVCEKDVKKGVC